MEICQSLIRSGILGTLQTPKIYYIFHKSHPFIPTRSRINLVHTLAIYFFKAHINAGLFLSDQSDCKWLLTVVSTIILGSECRVAHKNISLCHEFGSQVSWTKHFSHNFKTVRTKNKNSFMVFRKKHVQILMTIFFPKFYRSRY